MSGGKELVSLDAEIAVVGRGLIGSAAARHLAEAGRRAVAIGPDEPTDWARWNGPFSSHGDEGRITRVADADPVWAELARFSIGRYAEIETRSGLQFHDPRGLVVSTTTLDSWLSCGRGAGAAMETLTAEELIERTGIHLPDGAAIAYEGAPAGLINPRRLVRAQTVLAAEAGATVVAETATTLGRAGDGLEVGGPWGAVRAQRVLVTTGAFGRDLIARRLPVVRRPRTVVVAEVDPAVTPTPTPTTAVTAPMATGPSLPSLILRPPPDDRLDAFYWVPPVPYPDGRTCLKIGGSLARDPEIPDDAAGDAALIEWFHGSGDPVEAEALGHCLELLLPTWRIRSVASFPCVYTGTPSGYPTIDWLDDGLAVAIGGNGAAAKSSDELGRLAAALVGGEDLGPGPDPAIFGRSQLAS